MNPGDRIRDPGTGRLAFVLHESNMGVDQALVRFDGQDWNTVVGVLSQFEVLPSEPFRPAPEAPPTFVVKYHITEWPYNTMPVHRQTSLHCVPARWVPPQGAIVDEITVT